MLLEFIIGFCSTILVGISVAALASYLNRHFIKIVKQASNCVCQRLLIRKPMSQELFFDCASLSGEKLLKAKWLLKKIVMTFPECHVELLYPDDRLKELLKVRREELGDISERDWRKARIKENYVIVFDDDIFDILGGLVNKRLLETSKGLFDLPESEKEWYQFISYCKFFGDTLQSITKCSEVLQIHHQIIYSNIYFRKTFNRTCRFFGTVCKRRMAKRIANVAWTPCSQQA